MNDNHFEDENKSPGSNESFEARQRNAFGAEEEQMPVAATEANADMVEAAFFDEVFGEESLSPVPKRYNTLEESARESGRVFDDQDDVEEELIIKEKHPDDIQE